MKESDMKKKSCPLYAANIGLMAVMAKVVGIEEDDFKKLAIASSTCDGSECAMWESEYEKQSKYLPLNDPSPGTDWHEGTKFKNGTEETKRQWIRWVRTDSGDCGLKSKEQGCFYPG